MGVKYVPDDSYSKQHNGETIFAIKRVVGALIGEGQRSLRVGDGTRAG